MRRSRASVLSGVGVDVRRVGGGVVVVIVIVVVVVVVVVVVPPSSSWVWPSSTSRSIGLPSGSTISTWCSSQSSAFDLRIWAIRSGRASFCS